ncbi:MAG: WXG100 family type VII secretion target [Synergistaceae bacterium]|jgi:WXG100 family type VII secretion target|nr:WXG100 family type VII secretion target [Synergistaceae bacterium]
MANIKVTPESLRSQAQSLRKYNEEHRGAYGQMDALVHNLVTEWTGEAQSAFIATFEGNRSSFEKFAVNIDSFASMLDEAANRMEQADQELKAKMAI